MERVNVQILRLLGIVCTMNLKQMWQKYLLVVLYWGYFHNPVHIYDGFFLLGNHKYLVFVIGFRHVQGAVEFNALAQANFKKLIRLDLVDMIPLDLDCSRRTCL